MRLAGRGASEDLEELEESDRVAAARWRRAHPIDADRRQIWRARLVMRHIERMGPALRWWLLTRLTAEECSPATLEDLRRRGYR